MKDGIKWNDGNTGRKERKKGGGGGCSGGGCGCGCGCGDDGDHTQSAWTMRGGGAVKVSSEPMPYAWTVSTRSEHTQAVSMSSEHE